MTFIGHYQTIVDSKGRVAVPVKFKRVLGQKAIITRGYENALMLITPKDWEAVVSQFSNKGLTLGPARATDRFLLGSAFEVEFDSQGRFIIPKYLREYATISQAAIFLGVGNRIEIWSETKWKEYEDYLNKNISQLGEKLSA